MQEYIDTFPDSKETIYYQMAYYDLKNLAAKSLALSLLQ